ncbi:MAG: DUF5715 family protein [Bacteroidaceae bacterium]|nr:DUF5715 family protein [Bacteroidaceae bacterium]
MAYRRLKKKVFLALVGILVVLLFVVRLLFPEVNSPQPHPAEGALSSGQEPLAEVECGVEADSVRCTESGPAVAAPGPSALAPSPQLDVASEVPQLDFTYKHRIYSVPSYHRCFPDVQEVHYPVARANGVQPVANREEAEARKSELLFVGCNPYYQIDPAIRSSIPYLIPRASYLLQHIGRRFLDSLAVKQIPLHTIIVTSVLRTEEDVTRLRRINGNASEQSCHRFGTTFDISYNRYHTVCPPGETRRQVSNDTLKYILSEVLRDARNEGRCFVKYEVKQGCYHITAR